MIPSPQPPLLFRWTSPSSLFDPNPSFVSYYHHPHANHRILELYTTKDETPLHTPPSTTTTTTLFLFPPFHSISIPKDPIMKAKMVIVCNSSKNILQRIVMYRLMATRLVVEVMVVVVVVAVAFLPVPANNRSLTAPPLLLPPHPPLKSLSIWSASRVPNKGRKP